MLRKVVATAVVVAAAAGLPTLAAAGSFTGTDPFPQSVVPSAGAP